ncbi:MAG: DUF5696 domain-containing protein [Eubacterium sp.]
MLQASKVKKFKIMALVVCLLCVLSVGAAVYAAYLNTNRDTRKAPERVDIVSEIKGFELKYETDNYQFFFRDDRDIIAVKDKKSGYVWKTGLDVPYNKQIQEAKEAVLDAKEAKNPDLLKQYAEDENMTVDQVKELANTPQQESLNEQYTAMANSLITVEYYSGEGDSMTTSITSSAALKEKDGYSNELEKVESDGSKWKLECILDIDGEDLGINVYITFGEDGTINYNIPYEEITGKNISKLASIIVTPFMGASGGQLNYYNEKTEKWDISKSKKLISGYVLVPDGSGSLIRFSENAAKFTDYEGTVYGEDPASDLYYTSSMDDSVPIKSPVMPVFGISHGDGTQAAYVAYADSGDEYMTIQVTPSATAKSQMKYTHAYAKFKYNSEFYQVTNQAGDSYRKIQDEPNKFDVNLTYKFLSGDGSDGTPAADYTGMAQAYREHLIEKGLLTEKTAENSDIPIRIDFLMSDSKKGVFSTQQVTVTTADDVKNILNKFLDGGVTNINSGLIGWQSGGETLSKPYSTKFSSSVGKEGDFEDLMAEFQKKNVDISFSREFTTINETMISYYNNAAKHLNTKYLTLDKSGILPKNVPVTEYGYASPDKTAEWIEDLYDDLGDYSKSFTVDGASNVLVSTHDSDGDQISVTDVIKLYQDTLKKISDQETKLNLVTPNQYLWQYTDRYLQSPVGTSQYVYETDSVPFLQMVLHGTMEIYAPYSNFSFYSQKDMLKMIDYNISPSFVLTQEPSYLLAATTSSDYYSTEFSQYEDIVKNIYSTVNAPLSQIIGYNWDSRTVLEDGVIANQYSKDGSVKTIVINYTEDEVTVKGTKIAPLSAQVIEGGVK